MTNMFAMFDDATDFNNSLELWDVGRVTNFEFMFYTEKNFRAFNQPMLEWNTSSAKSMKSMFRNTILFNQDLSAWDVRSVRDLSNMFLGATDYNQSLCAWGNDLAKNAIVSRMFANTSCPVTSDPVLSANPPGPFCHLCV